MRSQSRPPEPAPELGGGRHATTAAAAAAGLSGLNLPGPHQDLRALARTVDVDYDATEHRCILLGLRMRPSEATWPTPFAKVLALLDDADHLLTAPATDQLARLLGELIGRLADALISAFAVHAAEPARMADPTLSELEARNAHFAALLPRLTATIDILLRLHIQQALRLEPNIESPTGTRYEQTTAAVAFVDLVGSTALAESIDLSQLAVILTRFETLATQTISAHDGRVVKLMGDGLLFTTATAEAAVAACTGILRDGRASLPPMRAGIAYGDVLLRNGDCFGPTVNLAARLLEHIEPHEIALTGVEESKQPGTHRNLAIRGLPDAIPVMVTRIIDRN